MQTCKIVQQCSIDKLHWKYTLWPNYFIFDRAGKNYYLIFLITSCYNKSEIHMKNLNKYIQDGTHLRVVLIVGGDSWKRTTQ